MHARQTRPHTASMQLWVACQLLFGACASLLLWVGGLRGLDHQEVSLPMRHLESLLEFRGFRSCCYPKYCARQSPRWPRQHHVQSLLQLVILKQVKKRDSLPILDGKFQRTNNSWLFLWYREARGRSREVLQNLCPSHYAPFNI
jgi:hypothetical protein